MYYEAYMNICYKEKSKTFHSKTKTKQPMFASKLRLCLTLLLLSLLSTADSATRIRTYRSTRRTSTANQGYRYTPGIRSTAVRYTTANGFSASNRFLYTATTNLYSYGSYRGARFAKDIRSMYWLLSFKSTSI